MSEDIICNDIECCCKCVHQLKINCHPWNQVLGKGAMTETLGWVCLLFKEDIKVGIFSENKHGSCECFTEKIN
jgi:hypothetical protein